VCHVGYVLLFFLCFYQKQWLMCHAGLYVAHLNRILDPNPSDNLEIMAFKVRALNVQELH